MLYPLSDSNPLTRIAVPWITYLIIAATVAVFVYELSLPEAAQEVLVTRFGFTPAFLFGFSSPSSGRTMLDAYLWVAATPVTSLFLHGSILHIASNMLFLWVFGDNVEDALGHLRYLLFYLLSGVVAAGAQALSDPHSSVPIIGASSAVSGIIGAYIILHPTARIRVLFLFFTFRVPALILLGLWFAMQLGSAVTDHGATNVAWWAHVGGFVFGALAVLLFRPVGTPVLKRRGPDHRKVLLPRVSPRDRSLAESRERLGIEEARDLAAERMRETRARHRHRHFEPARTEPATVQDYRRRAEPGIGAAVVALWLVVALTLGATALLGALTVFAVAVMVGLALAVTVVMVIAGRRESAWRRGAFDPRATSVTPPSSDDARQRFEHMMEAGRRTARGRRDGSVPRVRGRRP